MSLNQYEDEVRARLAATPIQVPVNVPVILRKGRAATARQRGLVAGGIVLAVIVALVAVFLGVQIARQVTQTPVPTGHLNPATPTPTTTTTTKPAPTATDMVALPRITVNRTSAQSGDEIITDQQVAGFQKFADDLADGNIDSIVTNCWTQPAGEVRARWSDLGVRTNTLTWLSGPIIGGANETWWWGPSDEADGVVLDAVEAARSYSCPVPDAFTPARALLIIQRLVDRHAGTPLRGDDTADNFPILTCDDGTGGPGAYVDPLSPKVPASAYVCTGTTDAQWAILEQLARGPLQFLDPGVLELPPSVATPYDYVAASDPTGRYQVVFAPTEEGGYYRVFAVLDAAANTSSLVTLPRIQVNRASTDGTTTLSAAQVAGVQALADDVADGNIESIVSHCPALVAADVRDYWSTLDNRQTALGWLSNPVQMTTPGWYDWSSVPPGTDMSDGEPGNGEVPRFTAAEAASSYACWGPTATPNRFTPAQAGLVLQRLVDWHTGTPYNGTDTADDVFALSCNNPANTYGDVPDRIAADVNAKAPGAIAVCRGILDFQWPVLAKLAGARLASADPGTVGLDTSYYVVTADPADGRYAVFHALSDVGDMVLVGVGNTTYLSQPRIQVNRTDAIPAAQVAGVQRFADDLADGNVHSIVTNCWTQAEVDLETRWGDPAVRAQALTSLGQPMTGAGSTWVWGADQSGPGGNLAFYPTGPDSGYSCPLPHAFTGAQAQLTLQRLLDRHIGTPLRPGDTAANYPLLSCDEPGGTDGWDYQQVTTWSRASSLVCSGMTEERWMTLGEYLVMDAKQGNTLKVVPASTVGLSDSFAVVAAQGPFAAYWAAFAMMDGEDPRLIAFGSSV